MSAVLPNLELVFGWLLAASWQASVLALFVLAIQRIVGARLNPRWRYALWLLVVLRLVLPVLPECALSLFQFAPPPPAALTVSVTEPLFVVGPHLPPVDVPAAIPQPSRPFSFYSLLALIWLAGALGLLTLTVIVNRRFARQVANSPEISDPDLLRLFADAKEEFEVRRPIRLIENGQVQSPAIMGLFRPTLLLPVNVREKFDARELRFIFLHELAHLKRGDVLVQTLIALLQILHWFNPVLWFAFRRMRIDREPATDALVLSRTGEDEKERYGLMLIKLLEHFNQRHSLATLVGILEDKDQFKRRFSLIARFTRGAYGWSLLGVVILGALAIGGLTKSKPPSAQDQAVAKPDAHSAESNEKKLITAAKKNDVPELARLLQLGVDVNAHDGDRNAILKAAESGAVDAVKYLLAHQADPNSLSEPGYEYTPLSLTKKPEIADLLLAAGANANATLYSRGVPIVGQCVSFGPPEMLNWFIAHGVDVAKTRGDDPDHTLLFDAGSPEVAAILIKNGVDVNARAKDGATALDLICAWHKTPVEFARLLLQNGADPNARDNSGRAPLSYAPDRATVELLIAHGANVKTAGNCFITTNFAKEEPDRLKALIEHGLPFDAKKDGPAFLEHEAWRGHAETVAYLLELGVDPEQENYFGPDHKDGMTPLEAAVTDGGGFEAAKVLVEHGAKIRPRDVNNALYNRRKEITKLFWDHGARSLSELVYAISQGASVADIQKLLDAGMPADPPQDKDIKPITLAAELGRLDVVTLLVQRGAKVDFVQTDGDPMLPLDGAAMEGQDEIVDFLLQRGAKVTPDIFFNAAWNTNPYDDQRSKEHFEKTLKLLIDTGALKGMKPEEQGRILDAVVGPRNPGGNTTALKMLLDAGLSPELPLQDQTGKNVGTVISYNRNWAAENPAASTDLKPMLEILEAADKGASTKAGAGDVPAVSAQVELFVAGNPVALSAEAQATIARQVEEIVRSSELYPWHPGKVVGDVENAKPEEIKGAGSYLHITYATAKEMTPNATFHHPAKEIYLGLLDNPNGGSYPGYPGGICLVGEKGYLEYPANENGNLLVGLGLNPAVYPHLTPAMKANVDQGRAGYEAYLKQTVQQGFPLEEQVVTAVQKGDAEALKKLIAQGADVKGIKGPEPTLLFIAGSAEVAEILIQQGVPIDVKDSEGMTTLIHICRDFQRDRASIAPVVQVLLKHGAAANAKNGGADWSPLMAALDGATVDVLVAAGASVPAMPDATEWADIGMPFRALDYYQALARHGLDLKRNNQGLFLLLRACGSDSREEVVEWLVTQGVDPNGVYAPYAADVGRSDLPATPLKQCAYSENAKAAEILIRHGGKVDADTVLLAIDCGRSRVVKAFWDAGARPISELLYAVDQKQPAEDLQKLLDAGSPVDPPQDTRITPLALAAGFGDLKAVQLLVERGADVNRGDAEHKPLYLACDGIKDEVVTYLLSKGATATFDDMKISIRGCYLRGKAAPPMERSYGIIRQLLAAGAVKGISEAQAADLLSQPMGAGDWHDLKLTQMLLDAGLNPQSKTADGTSVIEAVRARLEKTNDVSLKANLQQVLAVMEKGASMQTTNAAVAVMPAVLTTGFAYQLPQWVAFDATPGTHPDLDKALIDLVREAGTDKVGAGDVDKVRELLGQGASANAKDERGTSALTWALNFGKDEAAQALINAGADGRAQDANGENAAWLAAMIYYCPGALELMIKEGVDVRSANKQGQSILMAMMHVVPAQAGKTNYLRDRVWTAEEFKAHEERERRTVELLIAAGADYNGKDGTTTPLMAAAQSGHVEAMRALLAHGANPSFKDAGGNTALDLAKMFHPELVPLFDAARDKKAEAKPGSATVNGWLNIPVAAHANFARSVGVLVSDEGRQYPLSFDDKGRFSVTGVKPGRYREIVRVMCEPRDVMVAVDKTFGFTDVAPHSHSTVNLSWDPTPPAKGGIEIGMKIVQIDEDVYQANKAKIDAGVEKEGAGIMELLNQMKGVSLLSTPSVTTQPGLTANVDIVRKMPYPTRFDAPKMAPLAIGSGPGGPTNLTAYIPPTPNEFETRDIGVKAEITPALIGKTLSPQGTVIADRIMLSGKFTVAEFEGFTQSNIMESATPTFNTSESNFVEAVADGELKGVWIPGAHYRSADALNQLPGVKTDANAPTIKTRYLLFLSAKEVD